MKLEDKSDYVNGMSFDFNAEYLIACLLENGAEPNEINAVFDGHLKRTWSNDISFSEVEYFENGEKVLALHLNRSGIYDLLPESIFHDHPESDSTSGKEMARESMALKIEEKETRSFFRPLENELFLQGVKLIATENRLTEQVSSDFLNGLIPNFWSISKKIPKKYTEKLIKVLPFAHKITGNYKLTAQCLQFILNENVTIEYKREPTIEAISNLNSASRLGSSLLGTDSICGNFVNGFIGKLQVRIGPIKRNEINGFLENGKAKALIDCFYKYFVPVELDIETQLLFNKEENELILVDDTGEGAVFLGLNTFL